MRLDALIAARSGRSHASRAPERVAGRWRSLALSALPHPFADEPGIRIEGPLRKPRVRCRTAPEKRRLTSCTPASLEPPPQRGHRSVEHPWFLPFQARATAPPHTSAVERSVRPVPAGVRRLGSPLELGPKATLQLPRPGYGECCCDKGGCCVIAPRDRAKHVGEVEQHDPGQDRVPARAQHACRHKAGSSTADGPHAHERSGLAPPRYGSRTHSSRHRRLLGSRHGRTYPALQLASRS